MAEGRCETPWYFIAHILKDIFNPQDNIIIYDSPKEIEVGIETFHSSEFGIETWGLHSDYGYLDHPKYHFWLSGINNTFYGEEFAELFFSWGYSPGTHDTMNTALQTRHLMRPDGFVVLVNPGGWANDLSLPMRRRRDLAGKLKRYNLFLNEDVRVYQR